MIKLITFNEGKIDTLIIYPFGGFNTVNQQFPRLLSFTKYMTMFVIACFALPIAPAMLLTML